MPLPVVRYGSGVVLHPSTGATYDNDAWSAQGQNAARVLAQMHEERRREPFLESHRLGDIRRLDLPLIPAIGTPFPRGGEYGDQRCFPLPAIESNNNPNIPDV